MTSPRDKKLLQLVENFIQKHQIRCAESIYQVDSINEDLPELVISLCDTVGYYEELVDAELEQKLLDQEMHCMHCNKYYCDCSDYVVEQELGQLNPYV